MKKTKTERRIENAINAFFDSELETGENYLTFSANQIPATTSLNLTFTEKTDKCFGAVKKELLFLPGTFILYFSVLISVFFYNNLGITPWILFWFAAGSFTFWAGIGNLKNKNHLFMPLSVAAIGLFLALLFSFLPASLQEKAFFEYSIYLFPLALIVPHLVKSSIDEKAMQD